MLRSRLDMDVVLFDKQPSGQDMDPLIDSPPSSTYFSPESDSSRHVLPNRSSSDTDTSCAALAQCVQISPKKRVARLVIADKLVKEPAAAEQLSMGPQQSYPRLASVYIPPMFRPEKARHGMPCNVCGRLFESEHSRDEFHFFCMTLSELAKVIRDESADLASHNHAEAMREAYQERVWKDHCRRSQERELVDTAIKKEKAPRMNSSVAVWRKAQSASKQVRPAERVRASPGKNRQLAVADSSTDTSAPTRSMMLAQELHAKLNQSDSSDDEETGGQAPSSSLRRAHEANFDIGSLLNAEDAVGYDQLTSSESTSSFEQLFQEDHFAEDEESSESSDSCGLSDIERRLSVLDQQMKQCTRAVMHFVFEDPKQAKLPRRSRAASL